MNLFILVAHAMVHCEVRAHVGPEAAGNLPVESSCHPIGQLMMAAGEENVTWLLVACFVTVNSKGPGYNLY